MESKSLRLLSIQVNDYRLWTLFYEQIVVFSMITASFDFD